MRIKAYVDAHKTDATDAHDASAISIVDAGTLITATEVEGALQEIAAASAAAHIADATDAHDASAISVLDTATNFTGTDVEAVLAELSDDIAAGGIPATIFDAKGDIIVASAADTAARMAAGADFTVPRWRAAATNGLEAVFPPGYEFDYVAFTATVSPTATSEATANTVVTGSAVAYDGSTIVMIEFWAGWAAPDATGTHDLRFWLYDGASSIGFMGYQQRITGGGVSIYEPVHLMRRITPSAATHTYSVRASVDAGTGSIHAGAGGAGNEPPGFIRITKV